MQADQARLRRRWRALGENATEETIAALHAQIVASQENRALRALCLPRPEFDDALPISARREEIAQAIAAHQVVVVCGETGSGKTTQLPKICLTLGRGVAGYIGHTQPRRIAARSVAARLAQELRSTVGGVVGYKVRFSDHVAADTYIKLMTDGILLAETQRDPTLSHYDTLIIDEAHERSLNIDFILGYLHRLLPQRPDLKVIITSATIDPERFSKHFANAPIITVSGRGYPVEIRYRPLLSTQENQEDRNQIQAVCAAVDEAARHGQGDILVFLAGEREIRATAEALREHHPPHTEILPLYARLSVQEQNRVFQPHLGRRIVLATNVAETSLTVPGIHYVIDAGTARISRYNPRTKVQRLPIEPVSQASADQRAGRCGRIAPGICFRLYSRNDYELRPRYTEAEIQRSNLSGVILQMSALKLGEIDAFPFIDPPDNRLIKDGYQTLIELGALDAQRRLTPVGRSLARLPVDPRIGRMILAAQHEQCLAEVLIIAAALTVPDPRERPPEMQAKADASHRVFADEHSDFLSYIKLWNEYHAQLQHLSNAKLRRWCEQNYLSYIRLRDWQDIHTQLHTLAREAGNRVNEVPAPHEAIHRALLAGLLSHIAMKGEAREYTAARGVKLTIFPASMLAKKPPPWIMAAEILHTSKTYAHTVARIEPEWIEQVAPSQLLRRHYFEPHWEKARAQVAAFERVTLYGLPIVTKRRVHYGSIDPVVSREIFIRHALVAGEWRNTAPFITHNRRFLAELGEIEQRERRSGILPDEQQLFDYYAARVPAEIHNAVAFETWRSQAESAQPSLLFMQREDFLTAEHLDETLRFPPQMTVMGYTLSLHYRFIPGEADDGVTVYIPLAMLNQFPIGPFTWLVPGLLQERIAALLKSLPQRLRRHFVPVPHFAAACCAALTPSEESLTTVLSRYLHKITGVEIPAAEWNEASLPPHLRMNFSVRDQTNTEVASGRDLQALRQQHQIAARAAFAVEAAPSFERSGLTRWECGDLPQTLEVTRQGKTVLGYPALVDEETSVALRLLDAEPTALATHRRGVRRLYALQLSQQIKYLERNIPDGARLCLMYSSYGTCAALKQDLINAVLERCFFSVEGLPRSETDFIQRLHSGQGRLMSTAQEICAMLTQTFVELQPIHQALERASAFPQAVSDITSQMTRLLGPGFITATPSEWFKHLPRYFKAIRSRLEKLPRHPARDSQATQAIQKLHLAAQHRRAPADFCWLLEELRVSLFAQELKTAVPVSIQKLEKLLASGTAE